MNLFKNYQSKKQLRERIAYLEGEVDSIRRLPPAPVCTVERNIQKVGARFEIQRPVPEVPADFIKQRLMQDIIEFLLPFMDLDFHDSQNGNRVYTGSLYVATGDKQFEGGR